MFIVVQYLTQIAGSINPFGHIARLSRRPSYPQPARDTSPKCPEDVKRSPWSPKCGLASKFPLRQSIPGPRRSGQIGGPLRAPPAGVILRELIPHADARGVFTEFHRDECRVSGFPRGNGAASPHLRLWQPHPMRCRTRWKDHQRSRRPHDRGHAAAHASFTGLELLRLAGYRLSAYRQLAEGSTPAPPDLWTDLHMWRKFLSHGQLTPGTRFAIQSATFAMYARIGRSLEQRAPRSGSMPTAYGMPTHAGLSPRRDFARFRLQPRAS